MHHFESHLYLTHFLFFFQNGIAFDKKARKNELLKVAEYHGVSIYKITPSKNSEGKMKPLLAKELINNLLEADSTLNKHDLKSKKKKELVDMCEKKDLPVLQMIEFGWAKAQKGLLQVCRERGLLDLTKYPLSRFTLSGTKAPGGMSAIDQSISLI